MTDEALVLSLSALGHGIRLSLYRQLISAGPAGIGPVALASIVGLQRNLVSYHLQPLVVAGLVKSQRRGRDVNYSIDPAGLNRLAIAVLDLAEPSRTATTDEG